ncbi:MAG TPA: DOPA 4,5-dioxygenase family protein [Steroidobacteraceae bacterium]|jgi:DOPA 4,5-dioxygenase|nr:DOPA 4,5-dioxygenase family protein [Steroidobacteraceae bacterium]
MTSELQPYHAHIYFEPGERAVANRLRQRLAESVLFIGELRDQPVGPHPKAQFEAHFREDALPQVLALIEQTGLTALVHPLTDDDLADHTSLGQWIGEPLPLDLSVLDPPGMNKGVARFGKSDF